MTTDSYISNLDANKANTSHSHTITASASDDAVVVLTGTNGTNKVTYSASHANSGVTAGTYKSVTVNAKGHVTGGTNPTTLADYGITDALNSNTKYAGSSSVGGAANSANIVNITRPTKSILEVAGDMAIFTEAIYFFGSDGKTYGAPVNYVIINAKKGANHRTILDCYALETGNHYINGCMNAQTGSTVSGANVWTGWVLQPNQTAIDQVSRYNTFYFTNNTSTFADAPAINGATEIHANGPSAIHFKAGNNLIEFTDIYDGGMNEESSVTMMIHADPQGSADAALEEAKSYTSTSLSNYYTKSQIDSLNLISTSDIDTICGTTIQIASAEGVTF
jgi:phage-related tail fiber protein